MSAPALTCYMHIRVCAQTSVNAKRHEISTHSTSCWVNMAWWYETVEDMYALAETKMLREYARQHVWSWLSVRLTIMYNTYLSAWFDGSVWRSDHPTTYRLQQQSHHTKPHSAGILVWTIKQTRDIPYVLYNPKNTKYPPQLNKLSNYFPWSWRYSFFCHFCRA